MFKRSKQVTFHPSEENAIWKIEWPGDTVEVTYDTEMVDLGPIIKGGIPSDMTVYRKDLKVGESVTVKDRSKRKIATVTRMS
jgi:CO dehydrogenase nickel-insertion accessory protein CooC1